MSTSELPGYDCLFGYIEEFKSRTHTCIDVTIAIDHEFRDVNEN